LGCELQSGWSRDPQVLGGRCVDVLAPIITPPATSPPPVAVDPPRAAETAVDAQPILSPVDATAPPPRRGQELDCIAGPDCRAPAPALSSAVAPTRGPNDVITQVLNFSTTQLQQADPADGAGQYAREPAASNFGPREWEHAMLDLVVAYWVWLISALIAVGPAAGYWLIRLKTARGRGSADEAHRAVEARAAEAARWVAEARAAEDARRAVEAKAAEEAHRVAETKAAEDACRATEAQAAEGALRAVEASTAEEERLAVESKVAEEAGRVAETQAAEDAGRDVDASVAEEARLAFEAAEQARQVAETQAAEDARRDAKAKGNKEAGRVLKAKTVGKTKAHSVKKATAAKEEGGAAEAKAAEGTPRIAKVMAVEGAVAPQK
jgi:hypothetical protein